MKNRREFIGEAEQGGLGPPDKVYYANDDEQSIRTRDLYTKHVVTMFELLGDEKAKADAEARAVLTIETALAKPSLSRVELNQSSYEATYHKEDLIDLAGLTPNFDWKLYFRELGYPGIDEVNVAEPAFLEALNEQLGSIAVKDWRTYLRWQLIQAMAPSLPAKFADEDYFTGTYSKVPKKSTRAGSSASKQRIVRWAML